MKLSLFLLFACIHVVVANVDAQTKITVEKSTVTFEELFEHIKVQTGYIVVYSNNELNKNRLVNAGFMNSDLLDVLRNALQETNLTYEFLDEFIILKVKDAKQEINSVKITGRVTEKSKQPIPGTTVRIEGTSIGTSTDTEGYYTLNITLTKGNLIFSFIGFKEQKVAFEGSSVINIVLEEDITEVEEVVVTGIFRKAKESYTGAASIVTKEELQQFRGRNLISTLSNIDPAFNVLADNFAGSDPNALPNVQMRGSSSLPDDIEDLKEENRNNSNIPLIILDGFEISLEKMLDLNDAEVESITLLKDAAASSLYGSRAANGVVVITSLAPVEGKLKVSYFGELAVEAPDLSQYRLLNAKEKIKLEYEAGLYNSKIPDKDDALKRLYNQRLAEVERGVKTYWLSKPLRTSYGQNHFVKVEGGSSEIRYSAAVRFKNTPGVMKASKRQTVNGDMIFTYSKNNFTFRNNLSLIVNKGINSKYGSFREYGILNPYFKTHDEDGNLYKTFPTITHFAYTQNNPLYNATIGVRDETKYTEVANNFSMEWKPFIGLNLRGQIGWMRNISESDKFRPAEHTDFTNYTEEDWVRRGSYNYSSSTTEKYEVSFTTQYSKSFNLKHQFDLGFNTSLKENIRENKTVQVEGFPNPDLDFYGAALQYRKNGIPGGGTNKERTVGFVGNGSYYYDNRYYIDGSVRVDGSSKFGANNRFAPFGALGIGWNVHNEQFFKQISFIDRFKLRSSYGVTGTEKFSDTQALTTYRYSTDSRYGIFSGANIISIGNEDLKWQQTNELNIGLEMNLLKNRISFILDIYERKTNNLLADMDLSYSTGFASYKENVGKVKNTGWELKLTGFIIKNTEQNIFWTLVGSIVTNRNKIVKISQALRDKNDELINKNYVANETPSVYPINLYIEGKNPKTMYVVKSLGIDPATGKEVYLNKNGQSTYVWSVKDLVACGVAEPKFNGNMNTSFRYKNLSLNASFSYAWGGQRYNTTLIDKVENANLKQNVDSRVLYDRWINVGDVTKFKGITEKRITYATSRFIQDERYFQCQNVNLRYDLGNLEWFKRNLKAQQLYLSFNTNNIFYLTSIKQERGINYPFARRYTFTLSAMF